MEEGTEQRKGTTIDGREDPSRLQARDRRIGRDKER
jgi:hypothetical protein